MEDHIEAARLKALDRRGEQVPSGALDAVMNDEWSTFATNDEAMPWAAI
jgi:hypothetical protein